MTMEYVLGTLYAVSSSIAFLLMTELKYSVKKTIYIMASFLALSVLSYYYFMKNGFDESQIALFTFTIPSFLICFIISKYKGSRFIFTFCSIDVAFLNLLILSRASQLILGKSMVTVLAISLVGIIALIKVLIIKRKEYLKTHRILVVGWSSLAIVSILIYIMSYMLIGYPYPIADRLEYMPLWFLFSMTVIAVYLVMYQMLVKSIRIYNEKNERILLETKLELQRSQLELKDVYYKMAYIDSLTNIKNRAAFDKRKAELLTNCKEDFFTCVSMDLNNLKETNDTYGHRYGDELIVTFTEIMKKTFGSFDDIYRVGGDEFILIFEGENELYVKNMMNKLKGNIESHKATEKIHLSVAIGIAECRLGTCSNLKTINNVLNLADQIMYEDKRRTKEIIS